jgi:hypothetical protein
MSRARPGWRVEGGGGRPAAAGETGGAGGETFPALPALGGAALGAGAPSGSALAARGAEERCGLGGGSLFLEVGGSSAGCPFLKNKK